MGYVEDRAAELEGRVAKLETEVQSLKNELDAAYQDGASWRSLAITSQARVQEERNEVERLTALANVPHS